MTTLVATRRPLESLSMSKHQERRTSKRLAAAPDFDRDDDFQFVRKSKRVKTDEQGAEAEPEAETRRRSARGGARPSTKDRASKGAKAGAASAEALPVPEGSPPPARTRKATSRRKPSVDGLQGEEEEQEFQVVKRGGRKGARTTTAAAAATEEDDVAPAAAVMDDETGSQANGNSRAQPRAKAGKTGKKGRAVRQFMDDSPPSSARAQAPSRAPPAAAAAAFPAVQSAKIALPMSDTPIINRNKEMRKKGGNTNRRSSLGTRGRRASSLIESGQTAIPHREVNPASFYKHIASEGLLEPRRMKQLLTWCGERALSEKPPHGTPNSSAILGARAIQDQLLKDFSSRSDFSDWFSRDEGQPRKAPGKTKPNPRNIELDEKMVILEEKIKRLQEEKKAWLSIRQPPPEQPPLFTADELAGDIKLPDFDLLDPDDGKIRGLLADDATSSASIRTSATSRLRELQSSLEFQVDQLADNVHKLEQRIAVAGREADGVLELSARRLKSRDEGERKAAGTGEMPLMEVLRSLGKILPEGG